MPWPLAVDADSKIGRQFRRVSRIANLTGHPCAALAAFDPRSGLAPRLVGMVLANPIGVVTGGAGFFSSHRPQSSSASRRTASLWGFLLLRQSSERPER